jgi:ribosomal protein S18 acetylase RimI-like enzyme
MFPIRLATPDDLEAILGLIDDAADWLRTMDTTQWSNPWPNLRERDARVLRGLLACRTWLVVDDGVVVATVTYRPDGNHDLWTKQERQEPSVYMSRLVINRKYAGQGVGADLTDWAGARGRSEYGADTLRIDVWTDNYRLHDYYKRSGFEFLREHKDRAYPSAALFFKLTEDIRMAPETLFWEVRALTPAPVRPELTCAEQAAGEKPAGHGMGAVKASSVRIRVPPDRAQVPGRGPQPGPPPAPEAARHNCHVDTSGHSDCHLLR